MYNSIAIEGYLCELYPLEYLSIEGMSLIKDSESIAIEGAVLNKVKNLVTRFIEWAKKVIGVVRTKIRELVARFRKHQTDHSLKPTTPAEATPASKPATSDAAAEKKKEYVCVNKKLTISAENSRSLSKLFTLYRDTDISGEDVEDIMANAKNIWSAVMAAKPGATDNIEVVLQKDRDDVGARIRTLKNYASTAKDGLSDITCDSSTEFIKFEPCHSDIAEEKSFFEGLFVADALMKDLDKYCKWITADLGKYDKCAAELSSLVDGMKNVPNSLEQGNTDLIAKVNQAISTITQKVSAFQEASGVATAIGAKLDTFYNAFKTVSLLEAK